ncbi:MAG: branched-chain amino acid ABC transporter permease [Gaiellaceae bacterium]
MNWTQTLVDAAGLGAIYGLVAVGIGLVFGIMRLVNFAYGELITAGGFTLAYLNGQRPVVAITACFAVVIALALVQERVAFRPLRGASPATMLVATFAVSFLLQAVYLLAFGSRGKIVGTLGGLNNAVKIGGANVRWISIVSVLVGVSLLAVTAVMLERTSIGLHLRAAAADFRTARILGVRANRVIGFSFAVSGALAAAVSVLITVQNPLVTPDYGVQITIFALVGVVVGGLDRLWTATLGGFAIGFVDSLFGSVLPSSSSVYLPSVVYGLVIVVLLARPAGLFAPLHADAMDRVV